MLYFLPFILYLMYYYMNIISNIHHSITIYLFVPTILSFLEAYQLYRHIRPSFCLSFILFLWLVSTSVLFFFLNIEYILSEVVFYLKKTKFYSLCYNFKLGTFPIKNYPYQDLIIKISLNKVWKWCSFYFNT